MEKLLSLSLFNISTKLGENVSDHKMSSIMDLIRPGLSEVFALEFAKIAESDFVYTLASTNVDQ